MKLYTIKYYVKDLDKWFEILEAIGVSRQYAKGFIAGVNSVCAKRYKFGIFEYESDEPIEIIEAIEKDPELNLN